MLQGKDPTVVERKPEQSDDSEKDKLPFNRKDLWQKWTQGEAATCCDHLGTVTGQKTHSRRHPNTCVYMPIIG